MIDILEVVSKILDLPANRARVAQALDTEVPGLTYPHSHPVG